MVSHEALLDRLPPPLHSLQVAYRNHHFERVPTRDLIGAAEYLHRVFEASPGASPVRPIVAEMLVLLYHQVDDRLRRAPLSRDLLPQVDGVVWRRGSALAGLVDDIPPFMMLDVWISSLDHRVRVRHRATRRRVPQQQSPQPVNPPAPVVGGQPLPVPPAAQIDAALQQPEFHAMTGLDRLGQVLDIAGFGLGVFSLIADIAEVVLAGFIADLLGFALGVISSILAMPLAWMQGDRVWAYNNEGWAYCTTLYDMALPFQNQNLATPEQWPQIRPPLEPVYPTGNSVADQIARRALREGFDLAVRTVHNLERSPRIVNVQVHGQPVQVAVTGRRLLYFLNVVARARHQRVLDYLRGVVEQRAHQRMDVMRW